MMTPPSFQSISLTITSNPTQKNLNFAHLHHEIAKKTGLLGTFQTKVDEICTFFGWVGLQPKANQSDVLKIGLDLTESDPTSDLQYIMGQYNFLTQL